MSRGHTVPLWAVLVTVVLLLGAGGVTYINDLRVAGGWGGGGVTIDDAGVWSNTDVTADDTVFGSYVNTYSIRADGVSGALPAWAGTGDVLAGRLFESGNYAGVSSEGLVGYWRCEAASGTLSDWSGNGNAATIGGSGTATTTGKYSDGLAFDGSGYAGGAISGFPAGADASISAWVKRDTISAEEWVFGFNGTGSGNYFGCLMADDGTVAVRADGSSAVEAASASAYDDGLWHLLTAVRDYGSYFYLYVDGALADSVADTVGALGGSPEFYFGSIAPSGGDWTGDIDEIMAWDRALSAGEARALYMQRREMADSHGATYMGGTTTVAGDVITSGGAVLPATVTMTADDTSPTVTAGNTFVVPGTWTTGHDVTAFDDGVNGQMIAVIGGDADCNVVDGATVSLYDDETWNGAAGERLVLVRSGGVWCEVARAQAGGGSAIGEAGRSIVVLGEDAATTALFGAGTTNYVYMRYAAVTDGLGETFAYWTFPLPASYIAGSSVSITIHTGVVGAAGAFSGDAILNLETIVSGDSDALDSAYGNTVAITQTYDTLKDLEIQTVTGQSLFGASASPGELVALRIRRDPTDADDDVGEDVAVFAMEITW